MARGYRPRLTAAGERVHETALRIVAEVEELAGMARAFAAGHDTELSLAIDEFFPMPLAVRALAELRERFPRTRQLADIAGGQRGRASARGAARHVLRDSLVRA